MAVGSDCRPHSNRNVNILCLVVWSFINLLLRRDSRRPNSLGFSSSRPLHLLRHLDVLPPLSGLDIGRTSSSCTICAAPSINHAQVQSGTPGAIGYSRARHHAWARNGDSTRNSMVQLQQPCALDTPKNESLVISTDPCWKSQTTSMMSTPFCCVAPLSDAHRWEHTHVHKGATHPSDRSSPLRRT